jgi:transposase
MSAPYYDLIREMQDAYNHRLRLVDYARHNGSKAAARAFQTTIPTVRKWLRRYRQDGPSGLREPSRTPHRQPGQTLPEVEQRVLQLRRSWPTFGARRLIREFDLALSHGAWERIGRAHGLLQRRRRKYQKSRIWQPSKPPGGSSSKSRPAPRTSTICLPTGLRPSSIACPASSTPREKSAAVCCS